MKQIKCICDRCKDEIKNYNTVNPIKISIDFIGSSELSSIEIEICFKCLKSFNAFYDIWLKTVEYEK